MDKYINGSLVKRVLVFLKLESIPIGYIMWTITDSCFGKYIEIIGIIGTHVLELIRKKK